MKSVAPLTRRAFVAGIGATVPSAVWGQTLIPAQPQTTRFYARGAVVPPGLLNRIQAQNTAANAINQRLLADPGAVSALHAANPRLVLPNPTTLPAQYMAQVTSVKDQSMCGDCWAFAAIGAYEAGYLIINKQQVNVSEQELLDCTFGDVNCANGSFHEVAFMYMQDLNAADEGSYPYTAVKGLCISNLKKPYSLLNWGFVRDERRPEELLIASDDAIKHAILRYGPVASGVLADNWPTYSKSENWPANGIFVGQPSSSLKPDQCDHDVLITGWDDTQGDHGVWIIKNSWGPAWGDQGYIRLPYGCNNIGTGAAWVLTNLPQPAPSAPPTSRSLMEDLKAINRSNKLREFYPTFSRRI